MDKFEKVVYANFKIDESEIPPFGSAGKHTGGILFGNVQDKIEQEAFGTFNNNASASDLTLETLKKTVDKINECRTVYYRVHRYIPTHNKDGERVAYLCENTPGHHKYSREVLIHPDNVPDFKKRAEDAGLIAKDVQRLTVEEDTRRVMGDIERTIAKKMYSDKEVMFE